VGNNTNSTNFFLYDSGNGGLKSTAYADLATAKAACTGVASPTWALVS
jgi:hypothetical protein